MIFFFPGGKCTTEKYRAYPLPAFVYAPPVRPVRIAYTLSFVPARQLFKYSFKHFAFVILFSTLIPTVSGSDPSTSDKKQPAPSQSVLSGSSRDSSPLICEVFRIYIKISFSIHREAYVASFMFFSGGKGFDCLLSVLSCRWRLYPQCPHPPHQISAQYKPTSRRLWTISPGLTLSSPLLSRSIASRFPVPLKRGGGKGGGPGKCNPHVFPCKTLI